MNKENTFPHLEKWCKEYYDTVGLKIHPSNVPTDVLINELLGKVSALTQNHKMLFEASVDLLGLLAEHEKTDVVMMERLQELRERCEKLENILIHQPNKKAKESKKVTV